MTENNHEVLRNCEHVKGAKVTWRAYLPSRDSHGRTVLENAQCREYQGLSFVVVLVSHPTENECKIGNHLGSLVSPMRAKLWLD